MTFLDKLKNLFKGSGKYAGTMSNFGFPSYSQFGHDIFNSDVVKQAVVCIIDEIIKLKPTHIKSVDSDIVPQKSSIQNVLDNPNPFMTTSEFIEKVMWNYYCNSNSFIIPVFYEWKEDGNIKRHYEALYPVRPYQVDFLQDENDDYYIKMYFLNNKKVTFPYGDVIHLKREFNFDDYMGGKNGQPDNKALLETLELNKQILDSIAVNLKISTKINGLLRVKSILDKELIEKEVKDFNNLLENNTSGIMPIGLQNEYVPINRATRMIDEATLSFVDKKILRAFGVPLCILEGDYTKEQYEAFYQKTLEPIVSKIGQNFTKTLFTQRQKSFGNKIIFAPKELIFMSTTQTLEMVRLLGDSGSLYENEKRVAFGLKPLRELEGIRMQSLNYVDVKNAGQYQTGKKIKDDDTEKEKKDIKNQKQKINYIREKSMENNKEVRNYSFEISAKKDEKNGHNIVGRPIVYNSPTDIGGLFKEIIEEGALDGTDLKDVRFLVNHDISKIPLARSRNNNDNSTMQLKVDKDGMSIRVNLDIENNADAKSLYSAIERGDISGMSFMYSVKEETWDNIDSDYPTRHIKKISEVFEVSAVTFPAYEDTTISARSKIVLDNARANSLDSEKQTLESAKNELELEKIKIKSLY